MLATSRIDISDLEETFSLNIKEKKEHKNLKILHVCLICKKMLDCNFLKCYKGKNSI